MPDLYNRHGKQATKLAPPPPPEVPARPWWPYLIIALSAVGLLIVFYHGYLIFWDHDNPWRTRIEYVANKLFSFFLVSVYLLTMAKNWIY